MITAGICRLRNGLQGQFAKQQSQAADVRFGSEADIEAPQSDVRFTPKSGQPREPHVRFVPKADIGAIY